MSSRVNNPINCIAAEDMVAFRRVVFSAAGKKIAYADEGQESIGSVITDVESGGSVAVRLHGSDGTEKITAAGAITALANIYGAADGKVSATPSGNVIGIALDAATADGDVIEVLIQKPAIATTPYNRATFISTAGTAPAPIAVELKSLRDGYIIHSYAGAGFIELATPQEVDKGLVVEIIKTGSAGAVTISTEGDELINSGASYNLLAASGDKATICWNGTGWVILDATIAE